MNYFHKYMRISSTVAFAFSQDDRRSPETARTRESGKPKPTLILIQRAGLKPTCRRRDSPWPSNPADGVSGGWPAAKQVLAAQASEDGRTDQNADAQRGQRRVKATCIYQLAHSEEPDQDAKIPGTEDQ